MLITNCKSYGDFNVHYNICINNSILIFLVFFPVYATYFAFFGLSFASSP